MRLYPLILLSTLSLAGLPAAAQEAAPPPAGAAPPASMVNPHAGHMHGVSTPAPGEPAVAPAGGGAAPAAAQGTVPPAAGGASMSHGMMHGGGMRAGADMDRDGKPDAQEAHGAMGHGDAVGGMGGCKKMGGGMGAMMGGGKGGMMGGARGAADDDDAFHRDLLARLDRLENRLILLETLLRERLRAE